MSTFWAAVNTISMVLMALAAAYFFVAAGFGIRQVRKQKVSLSFQSRVDFGHPFEPLPGTTAPRGYHAYFLVACLNEAAVIAGTVTALRDPAGQGRIVVVDDASDDATGQLARDAGGEEITVLRRELPNARRGKGAALNAGFTHIVADVAARGLPADKVIVCVMDADGRLSDGAIGEVLPLFDDPKVGGAQLAVRIRNRATNFLLQFQDFQFWTQSSLTQFGRIGTDTVSLGGNGQFTRLAALLEVGAQPWSEALTEDLDLAVSMAVRGWKLTSTPRAAVDQQGVEKFGTLVRQRTRWYQGHMMTGRRLPEVLRSTKISHAAAIEMFLYLVVPWAFDLPWSIFYHLILIELGLNLSQWRMGGGTFGITSVVIMIYLLGFWPALVTAFMAKRRDHLMSWLDALKMGHAFLITNYLSYICAWRALWRMIRGQNGWTKTARIEEAPTPDDAVIVAARPVAAPMTTAEAQPALASKGPSA